MTGDLPQIIPVFPLPRAIVLPRGRLPLNIFEPRYLQMTDDALRGHRFIGMIQPSSEGATPPLYSIGCLGRLTSWAETEDGRALITLTGVCRFRAGEEVAAGTLYRQIRASYSEFMSDLSLATDEPTIDRPTLFRNLQRFLQGQKLEADWNAIEQAPTEALVNSLSMICPFGPGEKQALLEAPTLNERARVLSALVEMAAAGAGGTRLQ